MTTFIDFRYSQTLAAAMFTGREKEEVELACSPTCENYLALEIRGTPSDQPLASFCTAGGAAVANVHRDADGAITLRRTNGDLMLKLPPSAERHGESHIVGLRLGPRDVGLKMNGATREASVGVFPDQRTPLVLGGEDADRLRVMGRGSGRAMRWAELFYHRGQPDGLQVELAMDWHHLRAGIPLFSTMTAEGLIEQGAFRLKFRSYAYGEEEAQTTDFARLFRSEGPTDIATHLTPPLYAVPSANVPNLGFFVVESEYVQAGLVDRCNQMDAICVPSRFAGETCRRAGVRRPIHVVPHGVDVDYFVPVAGRKTLPGGRRFNFLAVCTHVERKNARHLVRAFLEEFRDQEEAALFLLLRPEYHTSQNNVALDFTEWERQYARNSAPVLLCTDYVSRARLRDLYANANAYVMPSNEGFGLTLLEAMACGTPVVGLDHGGVLDFLNRGNAYLVPRGRAYVSRDIDTLPYVGDRYYAPDIGRLRSAMRQVFEHEAEARQRAVRARSDCEARFAWDRVNRDFAQVIEKTHASGLKSEARSARTAVPRAAFGNFAWILCVVDDVPCARSLRYLKANKAASTKVLCLFTRYVRLKVVLRAREHGFMFYRWDGTMESCRLIARGLLGSGWIGVLFPGERLVGDHDALVSFLAAQPESVTDVFVTCGNDRSESRFIRLGSSLAGGEHAHFLATRIVGSHGGLAGALP